LGAVGFRLFVRRGGVDLVDLREEEHLVHFDCEISRRAEHGEELALRILPGLLGEARDLGDDDLSVAPAVAFGARAVDVGREHDGTTHARVVRLDPRILPFSAEDAGYARSTALLHLDDRALRAAR